MRSESDSNYPTIYVETTVRCTHIKTLLSSVTLDAQIVKKWGLTENQHWRLHDWRLWKTLMASRRCFTASA